MFLTQKMGETGIVFSLLIATLLGSGSTSFAHCPGLNEEVPAVVDESEAKKIQGALHDRGHYRGKVDGVIGLRTRAGIREFQKAESLPVTGQLDLQTAGKLGVKPESIRSSSNSRIQDVSDVSKERKQPFQQAAKSKPWAGTRRVDGAMRGKKLVKSAPTVADLQGGGAGREDSLQAKDEKPQ